MLTAKQKETIAGDAIAWVKSVSAGTKKALDKDKAKLLAGREYDASTYLGRIAAADRARQLLRAVNRTIRDGKLSKAWKQGELTQQTLDEALDAYTARSPMLTTLQSAYMGGLYRHGQADESITMCRYRTMDDERVRHAHARMHNVTLPKGHAWWHTHWPPNGTNCRCGIDLLTDAEFAALKTEEKLTLKPPKERLITHVNKATGEKVKVPEFIQPGYDFNVGTVDGEERFRQLLEQRLEVLREAPEDAL